MTSAATAGRNVRSNSNVMLLLSLKLILLAFFILLNSIANVEADKASAVIASVNQAFNGRLEAAGQLPSHSTSLGALPEVEAKLREFGSLFEAIVPSAKAREIRRAKVVRVDLPASALFETASPRLRPGRAALIQRLAESLRGGRPGAPQYRLDVLFGAGAGDSPSLARRRAAILAERLVAAGVPQGALSIGLRPGQADSLRFVVRVHQAPAAGTLAQGREG